MLILRVFLIAVGTLLGGFGLHTGVCTILGIVGKEPWMSISFVLSLGLAGFASARATRRLVPTREPVKTAADFERLGLAVRESYRAKRAFKVEEFEDEGPHYFVELDDGRVLYLSGQYLYDIPNFPCGQFQALRDTEHGWIIGVEPQSPTMPLDATLPSFQPKDYKSDLVPGDGDILPSGYDDLLSKLSARNARR